MAREPQRGSILPVAYVNSTYPELGLEFLRVSDLLRRATASHFALPQRPGFHLLLLVTAGRGDHFIDFRRVRCRAGTLIHVRPGQVQQFVLGQTFEANVLLFTPEFIFPATSAPGVGSFGTLIDEVVPEGVMQPEPGTVENLSGGFTAIEREFRTTDGSELSARILQHLLYALLLAIARNSLRSSVSRSVSAYGLTFRNFRKAVDAQFTRTRAVNDYAKAIGCSVKSLRRACMAVRGSSPKVLIEQRVVLEAKRLLAHTSLPVEAVADAVGFGEPTNFVKFFRRHGGMRPLEFRNTFPGPDLPRTRRVAR
jgi:AraC-like DNA-binding protein